MNRRLSICYAAPGHTLVATSGSARNILSLAKALSQWADVTLVFRQIADPVDSTDFRVLSIEPEKEIGDARRDDVAARGLNVFDHVAYLKLLKEFCRKSRKSYDVVLEKGWRLSGFLAAAFSAQGTPAVLIENDVRFWSEPISSIRGAAKFVAHLAAQQAARFYSHRCRQVIAETDELKRMIIEARGVPADRIAVVPLGVDHGLFRPLDQGRWRDALGISRNAYVLLYVGGLDVYHDMGPVIEACAAADVPGLELHLVGQGEFREYYEAKARTGRGVVRLHGQVPHNRVPEFIAAADLCLAPYNVDAFPHRTVSFSTLKIPEYMACARPVVSVPSGNIRNLIEDRVTGFLLDNEVHAWKRFFLNLPAKERLVKMGSAAFNAVASVSWDETARRYLAVCEGMLAQPS